MKRYRIVSEGFMHHVEVGTPLMCYWHGTDFPMQWIRTSSFYTYLEAQQYISFIQRSPPTYNESFGGFK